MKKDECAHTAKTKIRIPQIIIRIIIIIFHNNNSHWKQIEQTRGQAELAGRGRRETCSMAVSMPAGERRPPPAEGKKND